jgi:hypothetical protein
VYHAESSEAGRNLIGLFQSFGNQLLQVIYEPALITWIWAFDVVVGGLDFGALNAGLGKANSLTIAMTAFMWISRAA